MIGLGEFGLLHARAYRENPRVELVGLCDIRRRPLQEAGRELSVGRLYEDYSEMLEAEKNKIGLVSVAAPDESHAEIASAALGINKHVLPEKPMCRTLQEIGWRALLRER